MQVLLDELDRRQKLAALQTILVELVRFLVGSGHQHDAVLEQSLEQQPHQHGVRDIGDMEFVETEQARFLRDVARDERKRIFPALMLVEPAVDFLHEAVKVYALFACDRRAIEKAVHQKTFAAADAAPQVDAAHRLLAREKANQRSLEPL